MSLSSNFAIGIRNYYHWILISVGIAITIGMGVLYYIKRPIAIKVSPLHPLKRQIKRKVKLKCKIKTTDNSQLRQNQIKHGYKTQINRQIDNVRALIVSEPTQLNSVYQKANLIRSYLSLSNLYYQGIADKYDSQGSKIKGIPPDPQLAIHYLTLAIQNGHKKGLIELGEMYHYGFYDFPSDLPKAIETYHQAYQELDHPNLRHQAWDLMVEAQEEHEKIQTHKWLNLSYTSKIKPIKTKYELGQSTINRPNMNPLINIVPVQTGEIDIATIFRADGSTTTAPAIATVPAIRNDMHNVHDHAALETLKQSLQKLQKSTVQKLSTNRCLQEIRDYLNSLPQNDKKEDAIMALDACERSYLPISFTNLSETEILALVWNRIHSDQHQDNLKTLKENFADELSECIEHSKPVCVTGRVVRILDTLNVIDEEVTIKPTFIINEEMLTKAGKIRDDAYDQLSEAEKQQVNAMNPNDFQKKWTEDIKTSILTQLELDYVKSNILTEGAFKVEVDKWINDI